MKDISSTIFLKPIASSYLVSKLLSLILQALLLLLLFYFVVSVENIALPLNVAWSFFYLTSCIYVFIFLSAILYILPNMPLFVGSTFSRSPMSFQSVDGSAVIKLLLAPLCIFLLVHSTWCGPTVSAWFDHIIFSNLQYKMTYVLIFFFSTYLVFLGNAVHFSSVTVYDFTSTLFNFFLWVWVLFFSNNLFTFIFFLELLSVLVTLLVVTSTFSSAHFYNNLNFSGYSYFETSTPTTFLQTLMFFFWITLIASLSLFIFMTLFYTKLLTFEWASVDVVFTYVVSMQSLKSLLSLSLIWLLLLVCIFLKCGIAPLHLWKPSFFKGLPNLTLFFYIYVYYFAIFFYFSYVLLMLLNEMLLFNIYILNFLVIVSSVSVSFLLFESFYLKSFIAMSSILNSILIFFMVSSPQSSDFIFLL